MNVNGQKMPRNLSMNYIQQCLPDELDISRIKKELLMDNENNVPTID